VLSGSADENEMIRLESEGVEQSLVKPSDLDACFDRVNSLLEILAD
jgi:hypothetical protein